MTRNENFGLSSAEILTRLRELGEISDAERILQLERKIVQLKRQLADQHVFTSKGRFRIRYPREADYCDDLDCPDCHRREDVRYRCTGCPDPVVVPGKFVWHWQGKIHSHMPDNETALLDHIHSHGEQAYMMPWKDKVDKLAAARALAEEMAEESGFQGKFCDESGHMTQEYADYLLGHEEDKTDG